MIIIIITEQLGESWLELAEVAKRRNTWFELGENLSLNKINPTQVNSTQVDGQTIPNSLEVVNLARVGRTVWPGLTVAGRNPAL